MSDTEENQQIPEDTSDSLGEKSGIETEKVPKEEVTKASKKKPVAINKDGTARKTLSPEQQQARLEVLRAGRQKANIKRQLAKEALSKKEHNPPAIVEQVPVKTVKVLKSKKKKTIVIEESSSESEDEEEQVMVVKRIKKQSKPKQVEPPPLAMLPPPPRPPPRQESEADRKKKLIQLKTDLENKKVYKSLFG